jgi:long-chain-fatty-acyl-CoA reductase
LSFIDVDSAHPVTRALNAVHWTGGEDGPLEREIVASADVICAWGDTPAMEWASRQVRPGVEVISFGPKRSIAVVGRDADRKKCARALAHDVCVYDQQACFSVQEVFVEEPHEDFLDELKLALDLYATLVPKGYHTFDQQAAWSISALEASFAGAAVQASAEQHWSIVVGEPGAADTHPLGRFLYVHPVKSLREVARNVGPEVQTVAVAPWSLVHVLRDAVVCAGAARMVELGMSNVFRIGGAHDGIRPLQRLVRFGTVEAPSTVHLKGMTLEIDQTKFLEENRFVEFIP